MNRPHLLTVFLIVLSSIAGTGCKQGITLYDLKCENLVNPLGVGTADPRLSWKIKSDENGTKQTAWQIIAASESGLLDEKNADIWNSGKSESDESVMVPMKGVKFSSRSICYWKVRIWNEKGEISQWSPTAFFSVGLLNKSDWKSEYICFASDPSLQISPQFKRTFTIDDNRGTCFLYVNSLGYHEIYINGRKVSENVLAPAVSQFNKRSIAVTYDISRSIKTGRNDIVIWTGRGWYSKGLPGVENDGPLLKAQIEHLQNSKWKTILVTDSTWSARNSGYSYTGTWRAGNFGGERVDGSLVLNDLSDKSLDNVPWSKVITAKDPGYEITPQMTEPNRIMSEIKADSVYKAGDWTWMIDMGTTLTGWAEISFGGLQKGDEIIMQYSDHLEANGDIKKQGQEDRYIASGQNNEVFKSKFNYHGFRYIKVMNLVSAPQKDKITASLIHTDYSIASSFECSDNDLNRIHDMIFYTLRCLSLGGYLVDCPQIERLGYGGDGNASTETAQTMFNMGPLYTNWLQAWSDCVRDDGGMPHTAPNPYPAGGGPYWCGFIITASWRTFLNYGDKRILERNYPVMQKWLGYVDKYSVEGLLKPWPETNYRTWYLGDWAVPEGTDQTNEASITLVNNCFVAVCFETMRKIAGILGKNEDALAYEKKFREVAETINDKLYDKVSKIYGNGSQIDMTYPLLADIVPDSLKESIRSGLIRDIVQNHGGHIACGLVGIPVFTEWTVSNHESDLMYSILKKRDYPGYLYMIGNGATTTWEHWNGSRSRIHNCYNGIGSWFYQGIGGINKDENYPGYRHIIIDPQIPQGLTWARISKEIPYGTVYVSWKLAGNKLMMDIKIPAGAEALVKIPSGSSAYSLNGKLHKIISGTEKIGSGEYKFIFNMANK